MRPVGLDLKAARPASLPILRSSRAAGGPGRPVTRRPGLWSRSLEGEGEGEGGLVRLHCDDCIVIVLSLVAPWGRLDL
jgi:hypothetical protein